MRLEHHFHNQELENSYLLYCLVLELFVCSIFLPPYISTTFSGQMLNGTYTYSLGQITLTIMLLRTYLIVRLYEHYSKWTNSKAQNICTKYSAIPDFVFALKSDLKVKPFITIGVTMTSLIIVLGIAVMMAEMTFNSGLRMDQLTNNEWMIVITMATVGYGDFYPSTHQGRFFCIIACVSGMILVSGMIVALNLASEFTSEQKQAYRNIKTEHKEDRRSEAASNVIKIAFQAKRSRGLIKRFKLALILKKSVFDFQRALIDEKTIQVNSVEMLCELHNAIEGCYNDMKKNIVVIPDLQQRMCTLKNSQGTLEEKVDNILKQQAQIADYLNKYVEKTEKNEAIKD